MTQTVAQAEASRYAGNPIFLYKFAVDTTETRLTTCETEYSIGGQAYTPTEVYHSRIEQNDDDPASSTVVSLPRTHPFVAQFISGAVAKPIAFTLFRTHRDASDFDTCFVGQVTAISFDGSEARLDCSSVGALLSRKLPRLGVQRTCPKMLYSADCGADPVSKTHTATVNTLTLSTRTITVTGLPGTATAGNYFVGGFLLVGEYRAFIERQDGATLTLMNVPEPLIVGVVLTVTAGCDRLPETCDTKFNNIARHGGFPLLPTRNPFDRLV